MGEQHELLAVEGELEGTNKKIDDETSKTFKDKNDHFIGFFKSYVPHDDAEKVNAAALEESKELVTTVKRKLEYMFEHKSKYWDAVLQKEATNQVAKADLIVSGETIAKDLPATFLLGLETKLKQLREILDKIPTLAPGIAWVKDDLTGEDIWVTANPEKTLRTKKMMQSKIVAPATNQHPAQVQSWTEDVPIGIFTKKIMCGMLSPAEKSALLGRVDTLSQAVKAARQRANSTKVISVSIASKLIKFILG